MSNRAKFLSGLLLVLAITSTGQAFCESRGLIWEVKKGDATSYLMGSIHFGDSSFYPLSQNILNAFQASAVLYVEVDEQAISKEKQQAIVMKYAVYPEGESLQDHLSSASLKLFETSLAEFGVPLKAVEKQKPGFLTVMLAALQAQKLGYRAEMGVDYYFLDKARGKKEIRQIETFEQQMQLLSQLPSDEASLKDSFADMADYKAVWDSMTDAWKSGDSEHLYQELIAKSLKEYPGLAELFEKLFFKRNVNMAATAESCIDKKEVCFIVVGAGHLVGKRSVVDLLENKGYRVSQK
jgi:uncharacterized protein